MDNDKKIRFVSGLELDEWMQTEISEFLGEIPLGLEEHKSKLRIDLFVAGIDYDSENIKYIILLN